MKNGKFIVEYTFMKVVTAKHSGFCFGVKRAIKIARESAKDCPNIYIKGDLVHNEKVCRQIERLGIKKIFSIEDLPDESTIIIKAHGEPLQTYNELRSKNLKIIDATCPMVKDIHRKAKETEDKGYQIIIIGDKKHDETKGIAGNIKQGIIIEKVSDVVALKKKIHKKIAVLCQSTQNIKDVSALVGELAKYAEELLFINTICQPTRLRQQEIKHLSRTCEAVLIVGSKKSANTKRLYQAAKKINNNTFWISSGNIRKNRFIKFKSVGIIGGASTPMEVLEDISKELE